MCDPIFIPFFALCNKFFFYMTPIIVNDIRFYDTIIVHIYLQYTSNIEKFSDIKHF